MSKRLFFLVLLAFALVLPAAAQESSPIVADLTTLSRYVTDKAPVFISFRTDDDFLVTLNDLLAALDAEFNLDMGSTLLEGLDEISSDIPGVGGTYQETFSAWLGDTGAFAALSLTELYDDKPDNDGTTPWLIAFEVEDAERAADFWDTILGAQSYTIEREDGSTLYQPPSREFADDPIVLLTADALFIAQSGAALPDGEVSPSLASSPVFTDTLALLPEPSYNALVFVNTEPFFSAVAQPNGMLSGQGTDFTGMFASLSAYVPAQLWAFTLLDDNSLVMDLVQPVDAEAAAEAGLNVDYSVFSAADPAFLRFIPSGTPLVLQSTNLRESLNLGLENLANLTEMQAQALESSGIPADEFNELRAGLAQFRTLFRGATGLDLEEDVLAWMDGDYALLLDIAESARSARSEREWGEAFPIDFGIVIDATSNPEAAATAAFEIGDALRVLTQTANEVTTTQETIGGSDVWVFSIDAPDFDQPIELLIGADENVFVLGTRHFVRFALAPDGGMDGDEAIAAAGEYLIEDPSTIAYIFRERLDSGLEALTDGLRGGDARAVNFLLGLFGQSSLSQRYTDDAVYMRGVLTLPFAD